MNQTPLEQRISKYQQVLYSAIRSYPLPLQIDGKPIEFDIAYFEFGSEEKPRRYVVMSKGNLENDVNPLVRINSECPWGRLGSAQCDCSWQFEHAKQAVAEEGLGMVILAVDHVGKGVGLRNHSLINAKAHYENPDKPLYEKDIWYHGFVELGGKVDYRKFDDLADILGHYNILRIRLLTNNPDKLHEIEKYGIKVDRVHFEAPATRFNITEYRIKRDKGGHLLRIEPDWEIKLKKYASLAALLFVTAGFSAGIMGTIQHRKVHRFDAVSSRTLEGYSPNQFQEYLIYGPQETPISTKQGNIEYYLDGLYEKDHLAAGDIEKVQSLLEKFFLFNETITHHAFRILKKHNVGHPLLYDGPL